MASGELLGKTNHEMSRCLVDADSPQKQGADTNPIPHRADDHFLHLLLVRLVVHVASSDTGYRSFEVADY
jgi:hypothetical protein